MTGRDIGGGGEGYGEQGYGEDEEIWHDVVRKKRNQQRSKVQEKAITYFVNHLPDDCSSTMLWKIFESFGEIADAYVPRKKDVRGNTFGFVRFYKVSDPMALKHSLGTVRIDKRRVIICIAKPEPVKNGGFRKHVGLHVKRPEARYQKNTRSVNHVWVPKANVTVENSFRDVLTGEKNKAQGVNNQVLRLKEGVASREWKTNSLVGTIRNPFALKRLGNNLNSAGLNGFGIKYLGGLSVMLTFIDSEHAMAFLSEKTDLWEVWFSSLKAWEGQHIHFHRIAWLKIIGVPLQFWEASTFNQIGAMLGTVIFPSEASMEDIDLSVNKVGILINDGKPINMKLEVEGDTSSFNVWILEDKSEFSPDFFNEAMPATRCSSEDEPVGGWEIPAAHVGGDDEIGSVLVEDTCSHNDPTPVIQKSATVCSSTRDASKTSVQSSVDPTVNDLGPYDTPPPPQKSKSNICWAWTDTRDMGLQGLFNHDDLIVDTPSSHGPDRNLVSPDPFDLRPIIEETSRRVPIIDLNIPPPPPLIKSPVKINKKKATHKTKSNLKIPSMKMKDSLWSNRSVDLVKQKSNNNKSCTEVQVARGEEDLTIEVGECLGFRISNCEKEIRNLMSSEVVPNQLK